MGEAEARERREVEVEMKLMDEQAHAREVATSMKQTLERDIRALRERMDAEAMERREIVAELKMQEQISEGEQKAGAEEAAKELQQEQMLKDLKHQLEKEARKR